MPYQKAAILLSRQPMRPSGNTPWVKNTFEALKWIKENNYVMISSTGMQTWEMITAAASDLNIDQEIYLPCINEHEFKFLSNSIIKQFELDLNKSNIHPVFPKQNKSHLHLRDETVLGRADVLIPVSVRSDGFMRSYINADNHNQILIDRFETEYQKRSEPLKYNIQTDNLNPLLTQLGNTYLTHWTRTANYNWPDETKTSFWRSVASSIKYPRGALETLGHILSTGKIISSDRHMPSKVEAVSFTDLPPLQALSLMKWRARFREMSFEPYGIAIDKDWGIKNGIKAVKYFDPALKQKPSPVERWHSQSKGKKTEWQREHEYRYKNDFNISQVPESKLIAFCYKPDEIYKIEKESGINIIPITVY